MEIYTFSPEKRFNLPVVLMSLSAGFPSPGDDYIDKVLDLNDLVTHPEATFFMRVDTDSMEGAGIYKDDLLVIDKSVKPTDNKVIVGALNGELVIGRLKIKNKRYFLVSENENKRPFEIHPESDFQIHGVVIYSIKKHL